MAMSAEHRSKFAALHRQWWRLYMSENFRSGKKPQTNKIFALYLHEKMHCHVILRQTRLHAYFLSSVEFDVEVPFLFQLVGVATIGLTSWIIHEKNKKITTFIDVVLDPSLLLLISGVIGTIIAYLGAIGALREQQTMLTIVRIVRLWHSFVIGYKRQ